MHGINIAVLPFADLSPGHDQGYLADGLTEELICALTKLPDTHVVSQTSAFQYKVRALDIRQIGRDLQADAALEGSLRKVDTRVRITARLVDIKTGFIVHPMDSRRHCFSHCVSVSLDQPAAYRIQSRT